MCAAGTSIDVNSQLGFKISTNMTLAGVNITLGKVYNINNDLSLNVTAVNATTVSSPILTVLNNSQCSCQNVLYQVP